MLGAPHHLHGHLGLAEYPPRFLDQRAAGRREPHAALVAIEQHHTELCLELLDMLGQRRLGDAQALGSAAKVQFLGQGQEHPQVSQFHETSRVGIRGQ